MNFKKYSAKKDPDSQVDYGRTWGQWLSDNELIDTSIWIIAATDIDAEPVPTLIQIITGISTDKLDTSIWLAGGTPGMSYSLTNRITTDQSRTEDRTGILTVEEK